MSLSGLSAISGLSVMRAQERSIITAFSQTEWPSNQILNNSNVRQVLHASVLAGAGSQIRIELLLLGLFTSLYFGRQSSSGDVYDFEPGDKAQLLFDGSTSAPGGLEETLISDWVDYQFDSSFSHVVSFYTEGGLTLFRSPAPGLTYAVKAGVDESSQDDLSGFTVEADAIAAIQKIEVRS